MSTLPDNIDTMNAIEIRLAEHAAVIRALGKRVIGDVIEIGRRLTEAKKDAGHGNWLPWLEREFGWSDETARKFMRCHDFVKSQQSWDFELPVAGLYLLSKPSTPDEARAEVIERAESGERLSVAEVQGIVDEALVKQAEKNAATLRVEIDRREREVRAEYADQVPLSPETLQAEVTKAIDTAVKPLQRQLAAAERKLATAERLLAERQEPKPAAPKIDSTISLASTGIAMANDMLIGKMMTITPQQMVEVETLAANAIGQPIADRLGKSRNQATEIIRWLQEYVSIALEAPSIAPTVPEPPEKSGDETVEETATIQAQEPPAPTVAPTDEEPSDASAQARAMAVWRENPSLKKREVMERAACTSNYAVAARRNLVAAGEIIDTEPRKPGRKKKNVELATIPAQKHDDEEKEVLIE